MCPTSHCDLFKFKFPKVLGDVSRNLIGFDGAMVLEVGSSVGYVLEDVASHGGPTARGGGDALSD